MGKEAVALGLWVEPGACSAPSSSIKGCTGKCPRMPGERDSATARQEEQHIPCPSEGPTL